MASSESSGTPGGNSSSRPPKSRATRTKLACNGCKRKRRKCNGGQPCELCLKSGSKCEYEIDNRRKPVNKKYVQSLLEEIEALKAMISQQVLLTNQITVDSNVMKILKTQKFEIKNIVNHDTFRLDQDANGLITYHGPTSFRHMSVPVIIHQPPPKTFFKLEPETHLKVFDWFFQNLNKHLPLVDEQLFYTSIYDNSGKAMYASKSLINAIVAVSFSRLENASYKAYKETAAQQAMEEIKYINITQVQTFTLLATLEMTDGTEAISSCYMSMAAALSNHLGLHLGSENMNITREEKRLRERVFWCCFIVDRARYPILGVGPFLDSMDISTRLSVMSSSDPILFIRELSILLDIQTIAFQNIYSLKFQLGLKEKNRTRQLGALRDAEVALSQWNKELPSICRLRNEAVPNSDLAQVNFLHLVYQIGNMLIYKPFAADPNLASTFRDNEPLQKSLKIISNFEKIDLNQTPVAFFAIFALYLSTICCLFFFFDKKYRKTASDSVRKAVDILKKIAKTYPVAKVYLERVNVVTNDWKVPLNLDDNALDDDELKESDWFQNYESFDPQTMMDTMKFYDIFGGIFPN